MRRQKEAINQDNEAGNPHDAKINNKAPEVRPGLLASYCLSLVYSVMCVKHFLFFFFKRIKRVQLTVSQHYHRVQGKN